MRTNNVISEESSSIPSFTNDDVGTSRKILNTFKRYPEIEIFGKESSYKYYNLINGINNPLLSRLVASGIPISCALSLVSKLLSDICRIIDTIIESIRIGEFAIGNTQSLLVDTVEYLRQFTGVVLGIFVAWYSPELAAKSFLTNPVDSSISFLDKREAAHLYSMADLLHKFFIKHNIDYRICCGTALGAKREGGIIRNDDDIDLMLHPDSIEVFKALVDDGTFTEETGISIKNQSWTGGWQTFYADSPKGMAGSPLEGIGKPFIDIFPGTWRKKGNKDVISYGEDRMYNLSRDDYFTAEEWNESPELYSFGPTKLYGIKSIESYLVRSYGPLALKYTALIYPHDVYSQIYATPLRTFSILTQNAAPCYMRHEKKAPLDFDEMEFSIRTSHWINEEKVSQDGHTPLP
ncbi:LicD family protein [Legionella brunensis]|uniref:LicD family protein n=1 Tax=Legionella brunensis TaxID=29422 RepID=A0A0W0SNR9_9GAMM|nr:LicD family protein [Legionella brunensis]KTC85003.1 LicD family protein [Legionella brunensis]